MEHLTAKLQFRSDVFCRSKVLLELRGNPTLGWTVSNVYLLMYPILLTHFMKLSGPLMDLAILYLLVMSAAIALNLQCCQGTLKKKFSPHNFSNDNRVG